MSRYSRLFADISSNNSHFNAHEYRQAGHVLVAIKATEGDFYVNPNHRDWSLHAGLNHIGIVHYHFARPDLSESPEREADHFLSVALRLAGGRDYLCLDLERAVPSGWAHDPTWSQRFDKHLQAHSRFHTVLYMSESNLLQSDEWLIGPRRRVWPAAWGQSPVSVPRGYDLFGRQFTDGVIGPEPHGLPGIGQCDVSYMSARTLEAVTRHLP